MKLTNLSGLLLVVTGLGPALAQSSFTSCPATLEGSQIVKAPPGWTAEESRSTYKLKYVSVYNRGTRGEEYLLKPDVARAKAMLNLNWQLSAYRDMEVFVRCSYDGIEATVRATVPANIKTCKAALSLDAKGNQRGGATMACR